MVTQGLTQVFVEKKFVNANKQGFVSKEQLRIINRSRLITKGIMVHIHIGMHARDRRYKHFSLCSLVYYSLNELRE